MNVQEAKLVFGFHPFTERDVKDVILQNTKSVKRVQHQLLSSNIPKLSGDKYDARIDEGVTDVASGSIDQSELFGWDLRRRVKDSDMEFVFTNQSRNYRSRRLCRSPG